MSSHSESPRESTASEEREIIERLEVNFFAHFWDPDRYGDPAEYYGGARTEPVAQEFMDVYPGLAKDVTEKLSYAPLDVREELRRIREFSPDEQKLPSRERRKIAQKRLDMLKHHLEHQKWGVAMITQELYGAIYANPDESIVRLFSIVQDSAARYRLNAWQIGSFRSAIAEYYGKHRAVEEYRKRYPDNRDLFSVCFGRKPVGRVEIIKGPLTLHLRCYDDTDYAVAMFNQQLSEGEKVKEDFVESARMSGGLALSLVKVPGLGGAVTIERMVGTAGSLHMVRSPKTVELGEKELVLFLPDLEQNVTIRTETGKQWILRVLEFSKGNPPVRFRLSEVTDQSAGVIFDVRLDKTANLFEDLRQKDGKRYPRVTGLLHEGNQHRGRMEMDALDLRIRAKGAVIEYSAPEYQWVVDEARVSDVTATHEAQHQFNALFVPRESGFYPDIQAKIAAEAHTVEQAKERLIIEAVRFARKSALSGRFNFDSQARDEILAFYREGWNAIDILQTLAGSSLYAYEKWYKNELEQLPEKIAQSLQDEITVVTYIRKADEVGDYDSVVAEFPLDVTHDEVRRHTEKVFKTEYRVDLKKWIGAISLLEEKGYTREEVFALIAQEPVRGWPHLARLMRPKM